MTTPAPLRVLVWNEFRQERTDPAEDGEVFRSVATVRRGRGRIVYIRPGHETHPTYHDPSIRRLIANAVRWAGGERGTRPVRGNTPPAEPR